MSYAPFENGVDREGASTIRGLVITVVAASILVHGATATPLVRAYERRLTPADANEDPAPRDPTRA